jgi:hypothetical protein
MFVHFQRERARLFYRIGAWYSAWARDGGLALENRRDNGQPRLALLTQSIQ